MYWPDSSAGMLVMMQLGMTRCIHGFGEMAEWSTKFAGSKLERVNR
jgi:hypothetical protein